MKNLLISFIILVSVACAEVQITGLDTIGKTHQDVVLKVKIEGDLLGFSPNFSNIEVTFFIEDEVIGKAKTESDGIAKLTASFKKTGTYEVSYSVETKKNINQRKGKVFMLSQERPTIVVDIDGTISDYADWKVPFWGDKAPAFEYAPEMMRKLAENYNIVYLTARDDALDKVTMTFLSRHNFPEGPVMYNSWGFSTSEKRKQILPKNHGDFKYRMIKQLQDNGITIVAGIGNAPTDAVAYIDAGIDAYILKSKKEIDERAVVFESYKDLEKIWETKDKEYQEKTKVSDE